MQPMSDFDTPDYERKKAILAFSKLIAITENLTALIEWRRLIREKHIEASEYPILFRYFANLEKAISDEKQLDTAFNNPLIDLALMYGVKDPENSPGEKSE